MVCVISDVGVTQEHVKAIVVGIDFVEAELTIGLARLLQVTEIIEIVQASLRRPPNDHIALAHLIISIVAPELVFVLYFGHVDVVFIATICSYLIMSFIYFSLMYFHAVSIIHLPRRRKKRQQKKREDK